jgi:hypothetical protein
MRGVLPLLAWGSSLSVSCEGESAVSDLGGTLADVRLVDWFDAGLEIVPRRVRRSVLVAPLLLPGGVFIDRYIQEKVAGCEELVTDLFDEVFDDLLPPDPDASIAEGLDAV